MRVLVSRCSLPYILPAWPPLTPSPSITTQPWGEQCYLHRISTCTNCAHTHRPPHARSHDGWPSPLSNAQKHYPSPSSPEERDALLKLTLCSVAASPASLCGSQPGCGATHAGRCPPPPNLSWVGDHRRTSSSFNTSHFIRHYSELLRINHTVCARLCPCWEYSKCW